MKYLFLLLILVSSIGFSFENHYVGRVDNLICLKFQGKTILVEIGQTIPTTDTQVIRISSEGAILSTGSILPLQQLIYSEETYATINIQEYTYDLSTKASRADLNEKLQRRINSYE